MSTFKFTALLTAARVALVGMAFLAVGCTTEEETTSAVEAVDEAQEEVVVPSEIVLSDESVDADPTEDVKSGPEGEAQQQDFSGPGDIRSEPVPHPWVPKTRDNDNDT